MTLAPRLRERTAAAPAIPARRTRFDVLFAAVVVLLAAVHLTIFFAVLVTAPVTLAEQRTLALVQLPVDVARLLVLPFHALLLACLFVLGRRAAGRWAGFGSMLALLALNLPADAALPVYGPPTALGGWVAASLLALALVLLPRHRLAAAAVLGAASGCSAVLLVALPAFLGAVALQPAEPRGRARGLLAFAGAFAAPAALFQLVWLARLGTAGWLDRAGEYLAEFRPHPLVPWLEQERLFFAAWHFPALSTFCMASFLFVAAGIGVVRYLRTPAPAERGSRVLAVARRFPVELWAAAFVLVVIGAWWGFSGDTVVVDPNLPVVAAIAPLLTGLAYRGSKWLLTVNRFWALTAVVYLTALISVRSTQVVLTLIQAFHTT